MKKIQKNKITNIKNTDIYDNIFLFNILNWNTPSFWKEVLWGSKGDGLETREHLYISKDGVEIIFLSDLLEQKKNLEMLEKSKTKPASYSNVYSPQDELEIFKDIFDDAIKNNKKIHIVWITLKEEIEILEKYYLELWFFSEDINCFDVDFSKVLVSASVKIENIMWRGSDYKSMWEEIFFNPPVRESGQVKAMFKGINRWVTAGLYFDNTLTQNSPIIPFFKGDENKDIKNFLSQQILEENILPLTLWKILKYNLDDVGIVWENIEMKIQY